MSPDERLQELGLELPPVWEPGATLEMCVRHGDVLYLSAHMGVDMTRVVTFHGREDHRPLVSGRVGDDVSVEQARDVARGGALNLIATLVHELGRLERVVRIVRTTSFVRVADGFAAVHEVADAASDLLIEIFGDAGRHARSTLGVLSLPGGSCYAIEATVVAPEASA